MKCISCGGEVASDEERCPYCHTINEAAVKKKEQLDNKSMMNRELKTEVLETSREYRWNKILNRTLIAMTLLVIVMVVITFVTFLIEQGDLKKFHKPSNLSQLLDENYEKQDFNRLHALLTQYDMVDIDNYKYSQMALIHNQYEAFITNRNECIESIDRNTLPEDFVLEFALREGFKILDPELGLYDEISGENQRILEEYQTNVRGFFQTYLELSGEEIEELRRLNGSGGFTSSEIKNQLKRIGERLGE